MSVNVPLKFSKPVVPIVACLMPSFGIGFQGKLPWRLKEEMKYFKEVTTRTHDKTKRNAVLMGRKTWLSIPPKFRPLPGRLNIVLSRTNPEWEVEGNVVMANNIEYTLQKLDADSEVERIYIIGGGEIYNSSYQYASHMLVTEIKTEKALEMDTFLDAMKINELFTKSSEINDWKHFVSTADYSDNTVVEGEYHYSYALYTRK